MAELISKDCAIRSLLKLKMMSSYSYERKGISKSISVLKNIKERGIWIKSDPEDGDWYFAECSQCGSLIDIYEENGFPNFCPSCGADMRDWLK